MEKNLMDSLLRLRNHALDTADRSIHKREMVSTEQEVAEVKQVLLRQLRAVAMKEQCRDRGVSNGVYLHLATEPSKTPSTPDSRYYTALVTNRKHLLEYLNG